jgi:hypothetical protein
MEISMKNCSRCGVTKRISHFASKKGTQTRHAHCNSCRNTANKNTPEYRRKHPGTQALPVAPSTAFWPIPESRRFQGSTGGVIKTVQIRLSEEA